MEQHVDLKPNYRKFDIEKDKPFFATYLNTAKQNVFIILRDISESIGLGFDFNSDDNMMNAGLWTYLKDSGNKEPEITGRIIKKLEHHFPFSGIMALDKAKSKKKKQEKELVIQAEPADYYVIFNSLIPQLYDYRNYYTHAVHDTVTMKKEIIYGMESILDAARIKVKERFTLDTKDVDHLVRLGAEGKISNKFEYNFTDTDDKITGNGLAFFICLWLQRKEAQLFLKKIQGFKRSELPKEKATLETFTFFSPRIPQPRFSSDNSTEGLLLDMINELKRCPKELYPLLSNDDKEKFKTKPEEDSLEQNEDEEDGYEATPILKRSSNRFYYFALRYLEQNLSNAKFQIDLGNYCFHVYEQKIDGIPRQRRWIKRMLAFGNLEDFSDEKRPPEWNEKILKLEDRKLENKDIYMTDTTPHYHINEHNIGIKFMYKYHDIIKNDKHWPALRDFNADNKSNKPSSETADCWLSLYELPSIVFYQLLQQQNNSLPSADKIIRNHLNNVRNFFKEIENGSLIPGYDDDGLTTELKQRGLKKSYIPDAIIKYLTSKQGRSIQEKAKIRLDELVTETDKLLKKLKDQKKYYGKKPGSKDYIEMRSGNMADFLARDMIKLQKPLDKMHGKPNGTEFQVLQYKLAYFGANKAILGDTFKLCNLIESENPHPFLHKIKIDQCPGILEFYQCYLKYRKDYLNECLNEKNYNSYHFLKLGAGKHKPINDAIKNLLKYYLNDKETTRTNTVANLPRGLFLDPIKQALKSNTKTQELFVEIENLDRVNASYIIDQYIRIVLKDKPQTFYSFKKTYEILNKLFDARSNKKNGKPLEKKFFDTEKLVSLTKVSNRGSKENEITKIINSKFSGDKDKKDTYMKRYNAFTDNEKQIRHSKTCDEVLFMIADDIFRKNFFIDNGKLKEKTTGYEAVVQLGNDYKLGLISPESDKGFLSLQTEAKLEMPVMYETNIDKVLKKKDADSVLSEIRNKTIIRETIKIKNYGDFRAFLKDRRINSLLPYLTDREIYFEALQQELEFYQQARVEVFERIFRFEKEVTDSISISKEGKNFINHERILEQKLSKSDERFILMKELRNAFNHSNYPAYILFKNKINGARFNELRNYKSGDTEKEQKSIVLQFKNLLIQYYNALSEH